jgi:hypothetical protein
MTGAEIAGGARWAWEKREDVLKIFRELRSWFRGEGKPADAPGILILGPGGSGKSTLAKMLAGETEDWLFDPPKNYLESIGIERTSLKDDPRVSVVVLPGQIHRNLS